MNMVQRHDRAAQPGRLDRAEFLVIGAGPTGLGAAARLEQRGVDYLVVDAADRVGGAARAVVDELGFSWSVAGATGAQWNAIAERLVDPRRLWLGARVAHVDIARRTAIFADGHAVGYGTCISSAPLPTALSWAGARDLGVGLRATRVLAVGLGFAGEAPAALASALAASASTGDAPWQRLREMGESAPAGRWSVLAEVEIPGRAEIDVAEVASAVLGGLESFGATTGAPLVRWSHEFSPACPEAGDDRDTRLREIDERLRAHGFFSRGLLGGWRSEASDLGGAYRQGGEAVEAALDGAEEAAYWAGSRVVSAA
jgi:protoporphyrinogen oxidase